jgi:uncharacterized protein
MNLLHLETSPYLLQHANNPIFWQAWSDTTLATAKKENKLIIVSIGYSACHWCHVMEHESFENDDVASVMNDNFIAIKVDREERPDVDAIYMKALQLMTGQGGWPLNVVCLPDGRPVWGATYVRKKEWINTLEQLAELYVSGNEKIVDYADKLHLGIIEMSLPNTIETENKTTKFDIETLIEKWSKSFDLENGGYARAPKFMMPNNYLFLQRYGFQTKSEKILTFVDLTLTKMAYGGLFDVVDGGFSRYSVDMRWHIPHFEKMLYDNAQLVSLYALAYKRTKNELYKNVIEKTLQFVEREFLNTENGFFSALDADSLNEENKLEEGAFYVWTKLELQEILQNDFAVFSHIYNVNEYGFWEHENYVLIQTESLENVAIKFEISTNDLKDRIKNWQKLLFIAREKRAKPRLDDKSLTSWNALMLKGYLDAYNALGNKNYLEIAIKNAQFIIKNQWSDKGFLYHSYKNKKSTIEGFLEDYAFTIEAFIVLYQTTLKQEYINFAKQLLDYCLDNFYDENQKFFAFNTRNATQLIAQHFEIEDNVIPASNSVMANNLYVLSVLFSNNYYEKIALQMLNLVLPTVDYGSGYSNWLYLYMTTLIENKELAICGENAIDNVFKINSEYLPQVIVAGSIKETSLPFLENRFVANENLFYVCQNKTCKLPQNILTEVLKDLQT